MILCLQQDHLNLLLPERLIEFIHLDRAYFPWPWTEEQWRQAASVAGYQVTYFTERENAVVGLALFQVGLDCCHLLKVLIGPEYRGLRLGKYLLLPAFSFASQGIYLEVEESNFPAIALYQSLGLVKLVLKKDFYGAGGHGWAMGVTLKKNISH